jgi:mannitol-specific phosphotransferase system IIBC component
METSHIILLVVSASVSFAIGRTIMHMRKIKKTAEAKKRAAQALRDAPPEVESQNKSKRKRQMQQIDKSGKNRV